VEHDLFIALKANLNPATFSIEQLSYSHHSAEFLEKVLIYRLVYQILIFFPWKVMASEAIHPFSNGFSDLKRRLVPYRRIYVLTHPAIHGEPLVVLHVALRNQISKTVEVLMFQIKIIITFGLNLAEHFEPRYSREWTGKSTKCQYNNVLCHLFNSIRFQSLFK